MSAPELQRDNTFIYSYNIRITLCPTVVIRVRGLVKYFFPSITQLFTFILGVVILFRRIALRNNLLVFDQFVFHKL